MSGTTRSLPIVATCALLILTLPHALPAQGEKPAWVDDLTEGRYPVALALMPPGTDYSGADAVIVRRPDFEPRNVILIHPDALGPTVLSDGIRSLQAIASAFGVAPEAEQVLRAAVEPEEELPYAQSFSQRLAHEEATHLPGIGSVPWFRIWLRRDRPRGPTSQPPE